MCVCVRTNIKLIRTSIKATCLPTCNYSPNWIPRYTITIPHAYPSTIPPSIAVAYHSQVVFVQWMGTYSRNKNGIVTATFRATGQVGGNLHGVGTLYSGICMETISNTCAFPFASFTQYIQLLNAFSSKISLNSQWAQPMQPQ